MHALLTILFILLTTVAVADSAGCPKYDRKSYRHWIDEDRDCQNARHEVLIEESLSSVTFKTGKGCKVRSGSWDDPYSGRTITDATKLDIDHMVPLKEAHQSGAAFWSRERKRAYANDLDDPRHINCCLSSSEPSEGSQGSSRVATAQPSLSNRIRKGLGSCEAEVGIDG